MTYTNTPIRILHLISSLEVGGAEVMLLAFLKEARNNNNFEILTVVLNDLFEDVMKQEAEATGWPIVFAMRKPSDKDPRYILKLIKLIDTHNIQIIHTHDSGSKLAALLCKMLRPQLKIVFTAHETRIIAGLKPALRWIHRIFIDGHVAISKTLENEFRTYGIDKVRTIYNGINLEKFASKPFNWQPEKRSLKLVQVARYEMQKKGQDILLQALRQVIDAGYDVQCSLVGTVSLKTEAQHQELLAVIQQYDLAEHVKLLINRRDISSILVEHDVFVLPSRKEGFGLVIVEAMACGLPVIASNLEGPAELIQNNKNGYLFTPDNPEELAKVIMQLYDNPETISSLIRQGQNTASIFSIQSMVQGYLEYYQDILKPDYS